VSAPKLLTLGLLALSTSCALEPGAPPSTLADGTLTAALAIPSARAVAPNTVLTARGERVTITALRLEVGEIELAAAKGGAGARFDPAAPPAGYSLCHSGHCHADDGRLVDYADIQLELAGGEAGFSAVVTMPVDATLDLLAPTPLVLDDFSPGRDLSRVSLARAVVHVHHLALEATVATSGRAVALRVELPMELPLSVELGLDIDRDTPATVRPEVSLALDGLFFDTFDVLALTASTADSLVLERADAPGVDTLLSALADIRPAVALTEAD
jgi:hypothetical protein